jgi:hypothetical protein
VDPKGDGKKEHPVRFDLGEDRSVDLVLADGLLRITDRGWAQETLNLDGDLLPGLLRTENDSLGPEVDVKIFTAISQSQH